MIKIKIKKIIPYIIFILPAFVLYTLFVIYPLLQTMFLSFTNWDGFEFSKIVGIKNYYDVFSDRTTVKALINTCVFGLIVPIVTTILAIPLSLILNTKMKTRNLQRAVFFFPSVPSAIILGYLWSYVLAPTGSGIANKFLNILGIDPVLWLGDPFWAFVSIIIVTLWTTIGWHACIYLAQLQSIPEEYYEAAKVDGATGTQRFIYVTFPMLLPAVTTSVVLLLVNSMKVFDIPFSLTGGGPGSSTTMMSQALIKMGFVEKTYGKSMAMSVIFFAFILLISLVQISILKRNQED